MSFTTELAVGYRPAPGPENDAVPMFCGRGRGGTTTRWGGGGGGMGVAATELGAGVNIVTKLESEDPYAPISRQLCSRS